MWLHTSSISDSMVYMSMFLVLDHDDIKDVILFITLLWDIEGFIMVYTPSDFFWFTFDMMQIVADGLIDSYSHNRLTSTNHNGKRIEADGLTASSSHNRLTSTNHNGLQIVADGLTASASHHHPILTSRNGRRIVAVRLITSSSHNRQTLTSRSGRRIVAD